MDTWVGRRQHSGGVGNWADGLEAVGQQQRARQPTSITRWGDVAAPHCILEILGPPLALQGAKHVQGEAPGSSSCAWFTTCPPVLRDGVIASHEVQCIGGVATVAPFRVCWEGNVKLVVR